LTGVNASGAGARPPPRPGPGVRRRVGLRHGRRRPALSNLRPARLGPREERGRDACQVRAGEAALASPG